MSKNNVYVLDKEMRTVGTLEDLAPGESIYSIRFLGEKAYMVTFKKVDPLFVLDLSIPTNPIVLGKLKIPGYSDYLHPLDETHLLGIGKDAVPSKFGDFAWYQGMKLAIFDVSDFENPKLMHQLIVGDRGTDSEALHNHKAFVYDAEKQLLILPISLHEVTDAIKEQYAQYNSSPNGDFPLYGEQVFQGAFVYRVSLQDGFKELGRITHITEEDSLKSGYYYDYESLVSRALIIGNAIYTFSVGQFQIHGLDNFNLIKKIPFSEVNENFSITHRIQGTYCAGQCSYMEVTLTKNNAHHIQFQETNAPLSEWDNPSPYDYRNVVEQLDWDAFNELPDTFGCPGCADGAIETITISDGSTSKTIRLEQGMDVKEIRSLLQALRNVNGYSGYGYYGGDVVMPASAPTAVNPAPPAPSS